MQLHRLLSTLETQAHCVHRHPMASADSPRNPLQTCLQNLNSWFDSLPKPQIRLPWQPERSGSNKSLSASSPGSGDYSISGSQQSSASYHIEGRRPSPLQQGSGKPAQVGPVDKDELGRATWTFLHVLAAQYPEQPTKTQQKDVRALVSSTSFGSSGREI